MKEKINDQWVPPPNYLLQQHVTNGFSSLPTLAQVSSYIIIAFSISVYFSCTLSIDLNIVLLVLYLILGAIMIVASAIATICDPTDRIVYHYKWSRHNKKITFTPDYSKVLYCQYCDSYCMADSKHCRVCNRCVNQFDHHCIWLNNCVGQRNYKYFMVSIVSAFAYTMVVVVHVILESFLVNFQDRTALIKAILSWIAASILGVFGFLLCNLILLHIYLNVTEQSTYTFLQRKKKEEEQEQAGKQKIEVSKTSMRQSEEKPQHKVIHIHSGQIPNTSKREMRKNKFSLTTTMIQIRHSTSEISSDVIFEHKNSQDNIQQHKSIQEEKEQQKQEDKKQVSFCRQEENDMTVVRENSINQELKSDQSTGKLPAFLRKNRSLNLLLSPVQAEQPSKKRLQTIR